MAKQSGMGARFLVGGYDISGNIQDLNNVHGGPAPWDVADITQSAHARIGLKRDGDLGVSVYMDPSNAHPVLSALPVADELMTFMLPALAVGGAACCLNAKQIGYDPTRGADGSLILKTQGQGNGYGLEWGVTLTPGVRADTGAVNGTSLDSAAGLATPAVPASGTPVTNTSPLPVTVVISGGTMSNVVINGVSVGTGAGTYTLPAGQSITLTYSAAPTWTWTAQTAFGAQAYLQAVQFTGTSASITVQHSPDNATWSTLIAFAAVTAAPGTQRLPANGTVSRYLRVISAGTFSSLSFAVVVCRNPVAVSF